MPPKSRPPEAAMVVTPAFKLVSVTVLGLTLVSLGVTIGLCFVKTLSDHQKELFESCSTTWKMGFGAIVGLIGGKTT